MVKWMIVDAGGRGHALALEHCRDKNVKEVLVVPGNEGMLYNRINAGLPENNYTTKRNILVNPTQAKEPLKNPQELLRVAQEYKPDYIEVQQDDALAHGTVDILEANGFEGRVLGPRQNASILEYDKEWARDFMKRHALPHPEYKAFRSTEQLEATQYALQILRRSSNVFFKATGLCGGKGVFKVSTQAEVVSCLNALTALGKPAERFLIEREVKGEEFSYYALVSGTDYKIFTSAQDNKDAEVRNKGKKTGGIGAHSPAFITHGLEQRIENEIFRPAINKLAEEGRPYKGILYLGGMVDIAGNPIIIEFNARWGDPEVQVVAPAIDASNDGATYTKLVTAAIENRLGKVTLKQDALSRVCIVGTVAGYPDAYPKGKQIWINTHLVPQGAYFASAGIRGDNPFYTAGGRFIGAIAQAENIYDAQTKARQTISCVTVEDNMLHYRHDIAERDVKRFLES